MIVFTGLVLDKTLRYGGHAYQLSGEKSISKDSKMSGKEASSSAVLSKDTEAPAKEAPVTVAQDLGTAPPRSIEDRELVSAFVITFNEELHIRACLESLLFCDEIIVIDSFSTDKTVEIAESMGAQVIQREWPGYRKQKAFGLSQVSSKWVINLDADERISPELRKSILEVLKTEKSSPSGDDLAGYSINRVVYHLGRWWRSGGWYPEYRLRFFKKESVEWGGRDPHEKPIPKGKVDRLQGELHHYTYKSLEDQFQRLSKFATVAAEEAFSEGKRVGFLGILLKPLVRMFKFYFIKLGFREGTAGLVVCIAEGMYTFMKYAKLWELSKFGSEYKTFD